MKRDHDHSEKQDDKHHEHHGHHEHHHKKRHTTDDKEWKDLLAKYTIRDLLAKRKKDLITINQDSTLGHAMTVRI